MGISPRKHGGYIQQIYAFSNGGISPKETRSFLGIQRVAQGRGFGVAHFSVKETTRHVAISQVGQKKPSLTSESELVPWSPANTSVLLYFDSLDHEMK